ncbi:MAG: hypothetical protein RIC38_13565 [Chromatocurvus sp.]
MDKRSRDRSSLDGFLRQHRRLVLLVSAVAFVIGFVGGSLFMLQQAFAAVAA